MRFSLWNRERDPVFKHVRPFVDPRLNQIDPNIERIWRERVKANQARREAEREEQKRFDAIAAEYDLPALLRRQAG
jgi:hypothetical protein